MTEVVIVSQSCRAVITSMGFLWGVRKERIWGVKRIGQGEALATERGWWKGGMSPWREIIVSCQGVLYILRNIS